MQLQRTALLLALSQLLRGTILLVCAQGDAPEDKQILVSSAPEWARMRGWNLSLPISSWSDVLWDDTGDTYDLFIMDALLVGSLPSEWSHLSQMTSLVLNGCNITGTLPESWSNMTQLTSLYLLSNLLTGSLPDSWGALPQLEDLLLSSNLLTGSLPDSWSALPQLENLRLWSNLLTGSLPDSWSALPQLENLNLSNNLLTGSLPDSWSAFPQLEDLYLSSNLLTGSLPDSWSAFPQLSSLGVANNKLHGTLPSKLGLLGDTGSYLNASHNRFTGPLPATWSNKSFGTLDLSYNSLSGTLPSAWEFWQDSRYLDISDNSLTGTIPSPWQPLEVLNRLAYLDLHNNSLTGALPAWLGTAPDLQYIDLANNGFTGSVPPVLSSVPQVLYISFADNQLTGTIPMLPSSARVLNMSSNMLTQPTFANLPASLELLYLADNNLTGSIPTAQELPASLALLDLASNNMSGTLPSALPANLSVLNVSGNSLTGSLPSSWDAALLFEARLDNNPLSGTLPSSWAGWGERTSNSLQLSIVNTSLSGHMPHEWVQQFCLSINHSTHALTLFTPIEMETIATGNFTAGPLVELAAQQASINVTLDNKYYTFGYGDPHAICGIANAVRISALMWGLFVALLLGAMLCTCVWLRRKHVTGTNRVSSWYMHVKSLLLNKVRFVPEQLAGRVWFFLFDVIYSLYSQVTDIITIHQVFLSRQSRYAYLLLGILLLPVIFLQLLVCRVSIKMCQGAMNGSRAHTLVACLVGLLLSPIVLVVLLVAMLLHGIGVPLPAWFQHLKVDLFTAYRTQSLAEAFLNALPQSILQTKLYLMGNDPNGVHVYIDTSLFLFSIVGSFLSIIKSVVYVSIEHHKSSCDFATYSLKLLKLEAFEYGPLAESRGGA